MALLFSIDIRYSNVNLMHPVEQEKKKRPEKSSDPKMTESKLTILFTNID